MRSTIGTRHTYHWTQQRASSTPGTSRYLPDRYLIRPYFCSNPDSAMIFWTGMLRGTKSDVTCAPDSVITIMSSSRMKFCSSVMELGFDCEHEPGAHHVGAAAEVV